MSEKISNENLRELLTELSYEQFEGLVIEYMDADQAWASDDIRYDAMTMYAQRYIFPIVAASKNVYWHLDKGTEASEEIPISSPIASLTPFFSTY